MRKRSKTPRAKLIKELDKLFAQKIKSVGYCQKCGKKEGLQVAHIFSRRNKCIRWNEGNAVCLCLRCHLYWSHKEPYEFIKWVSEFKDLDKLQEIKNENKPLKLHDLEELLTSLERKLKEENGKF